MKNDIFDTLVTKICFNFRRYGLECIYERINNTCIILTGKNKKKYAKDHQSTINPPLFNEQDDTYMLDKCIIPELHILMGFVNQLFWDGLVPLVGRDKALLWPEEAGATSKDYHGEVFEGNACRKLLKKADLLCNVKIYEEVGILKIVPYISTFKTMNKIVKCCFSSRKVGPNLSQYIIKLKKNFLALEEVSITLKIHVAFI